MSPHEEEYFNIILQMAVERFSERALYRLGSVEEVIRKLRDDPQGDGVWLDQFVDVFFNDLLLHQIEGYAFIVRALSDQPIRLSSLFDGPNERAETLETILRRLAVTSFADLLQKKTIEVLEQQSMYGGV